MSKAKAGRRLESHVPNARDQNAMRQATRHQIQRMSRIGQALNAIVPRAGR